MEERKCRVRVDGETREYPAGTTYQAIAEDYQARYEHQIVLVFAGQNHLQELRKRVEKDDQMRENIANALQIETDQVNVKATTEEGLGFTGTGEGISSQAVCALEKYMNYSSMDVTQGSPACSGCCARGAGKDSQDDTAEAGTE